METSEVVPPEAIWRSDAAMRWPGRKLFKSLGMRKLLAQFVRYSLVGGLAFVVDFGLLSAVLALDGHYLLATLIGFLGGVVTNYFLCVLWVWRGTQAKTARDIYVFTLIGVGGLLLTGLLMWVSVGLLALHPQMSKLVIAAVVLMWNFGLRRLFVFFR